VKNPGQPDLDHAEAFRDLEAPIASLFCMAEIAAEVTNERNTDERIEMTHFAVYRLRNVIRDLRLPEGIAHREGAAVMNNEISEETKRALADLPRRRAAERLDRDGSHSTAAVQRRVRVLAQERNIPPADFAKLMHKRILTQHVMAFCEKHKVSYDWLLCGDLQGLRRMTQEAKATPSEMTEALRKEVTRLFLALSPKMQAAALGCMQELTARAGGIRS
jgi:hypothetical protein